MAAVDVIVVSYNNSRVLRDCVAPLLAEAEVNIIVVDNASTDGSLAAIDDLPLQRVEMTENVGFARGVNAGVAEGKAPFVLLLNPDARIIPAALSRLVERMQREARVGAVGPRIEEPGAGLEYSQRRNPSLTRTLARAVFAHRAFPRAAWADEIVRDEAAYTRVSSPDWLSGACLLVSREAFEQLGGLDERFFMYSEDADLCRRLRDAGFQILYEPQARVLHEGGASAPRPTLYAWLVRSRLRYAAKHHRAMYRRFEALGLAVEAAVRAVGHPENAARRGHRAALRVALSGLVRTP